MRNDFLIFGSVNSADYNVGIYGDKLFNAPEREYTKYTVPGHDGDLVIDNNRYKNKNVVYHSYIAKDFPANMDAFRNALMSQTGYQRLEDTIRPYEFRLGIVKPFDVEMVGVLKGGTFDLTFECKPQRFLKDGEKVLEYTANGTILNRTQCNAKPLIRIYGSSSGTVGIGAETITISSISTYVDIDCEIMDAFKGYTNCNGNVSFTDDIILKPGKNGVTMTGGITKVEIKPRWYIL